MYSFVETKPFQGCSSLYEVYYKETLITVMVVGYCPLNHIYYFTEYRGRSGDEFIHIPEEFCSILSEFSELFMMMEPKDIISDNYKYLTYKDEMPEISLDKLYIYDSAGEISYSNTLWTLLPCDDVTYELTQLGILENSQFLLEDYDSDYYDGEELLVDLATDPFYCDGDSVEGFFIAIKDWNKVHNIALAKNN